MRLLRHLLAPSPRSTYPEASLRRIADAVHAGEQRHSGEICFAVEASLPWLAVLRGLDARGMVVLGDDDQHRVVDALAPEFPRIEHALGVLLDVLGFRARDHQHLQLAALASLQGQRLLFELLPGGGVERAGGIDHRRIERGNRPQLLRARCEGQAQQ
jgi:hypothetical protein